MISILIPAYNEVDRIHHTIAAARSLELEGRAIEIIVVDDGSQVATAIEAERAGADTVLRQSNRGKGAALEAAFALSSGDILLLLDADVGSSAVEAEMLLAPVLSSVADMTIASFPVLPGKGGGMGLVVRLARWGIRKLTGRAMMSPLSGQRAMRRDVLLDSGGFAAGWGVEIALTVTALRAGKRVLEIPTQMTHRVTGRTFSEILHRGSQFFDAAHTLFQLWRAPRSVHDAAVLLPGEKK